MRPAGFHCAGFTPCAHPVTPLSHPAHTLRTPCSHHARAQVAAGWADAPSGLPLRWLRRSLPLRPRQLRAGERAESGTRGRQTGVEKGVDLMQHALLGAQVLRGVFAHHWAPPIWTPSTTSRHTAQARDDPPHAQLADLLSGLHLVAWSKERKCFEARSQRLDARGAFACEMVRRWVIRTARRCRNSASRSDRCWACWFAG